MALFDMRDMTSSVHQGAENPPPVKPLTAGAVFWSVFLALWAFGISAGILFAIVRSILT